MTPLQRAWEWFTEPAKVDPVEYEASDGRVIRARAHQLGSVIDSDLDQITSEAQLIEATQHFRLLEDEAERRWASFDEKGVQLLAGSVAIFAASIALMDAEVRRAPQAAMVAVSDQRAWYCILAMAGFMAATLFHVWQVLRTYFVVGLNVREALTSSASLVGPPSVPRRLSFAQAAQAELRELRLVHFRARIMCLVDRNAALAAKAKMLGRAYICVALQVLVLVVEQLVN
jgi:hypothetical protein